MANLQLRFGLAFGFIFSSILPSFAQQSAKSSPPDLTPYVRPAIPSDIPAARPAAPGPFAPGVNLIRQVDTVVNNTDSTLKNTDTFNDGETSIAINPNNRSEIVVSAFSGSWATYPSYAPVWLSMDGGQTWTKEFTITQPFGVTGTSGCPCDQTYDFGTTTAGTANTTVLFGALLAEAAAGGNIYSGDIFNPALVNNWAYWTTGSGNPSLQTNLSSTDADQPWLLYNRGTSNAAQQNVYVGYGDFTTNPVTDRVSASNGGNTPPQFSTDPAVGTSSGAINPGLRLAKDPRNGWMYSLYQNCISNCATLAANPKTIEYHLNRSTDQGASWSLNGSSTGVLVSVGLSTQPQPKFGTVNALLGGVVAGAVDPSSGDLYYVWGSADSSLDNGLLIIRAFNNGSGGVSFDTFHDVFAPTSGIQAALPQVAVTQDGTVGVFYYTYNGMVSGFPQFTTWLATSTNKGQTFTTTALATFLSPATDNGDDRQRVFGDYMQMKAVGDCFYGSYTGNGAAFGRTASNNDPIFFKACTAGGAANRDFNGDGNSDILWRDTSGDIAIWLMNGTSILPASAGLGNVPTNWQIIDTGDFNGDGKADILWRDNLGNIAMWFMNGTSVLPSSAGLGNVPTNWSIVGVGDFNGDGFSDILWRDNLGNIAIWFMNGTSVLPSSGGLGNVPTNWNIVATGDFNGDGKADILWRDNLGNVTIWFMNGTSVLPSSGAVAQVPTNWKIIGTSDFSGDGMSDILWRDSISGANAIWFMNGTLVTNSSSAGLNAVATNWTVPQLGDFNGSGDADILWRDNLGNISMWLMNGTTLTNPSNANVSSVSTTWQIVGRAGQGN